MYEGWVLVQRCHKSPITASYSHNVGDGKYAKTYFSRGLLSYTISWSLSPNGRLILPPKISAGLSHAPSKRAEAKARRLNSDDELRYITERRSFREREREAWRPFHQFVNQVSKERERLQEEAGHPELVDRPLSNPNVAQHSLNHDRTIIGQAAALVPADINPTACERVKSLWMKREIWNPQ
ncbi:hypothetical protein EDB81DRAFT_751770 [Dactylonectria macrodidyma]|uniref:Uncharacterized protein n=1 Tax=Dactylonectria macrodidyma TaxID=307937 RepID=A0A9P9FSP4_9HYPO|nr:hypothetical protein EDB81DRAFT_751770 [Dactylonectria macrodidyma]